MTSRPYSKYLFWAYILVGFAVCMLLVAENFFIHSDVDRNQNRSYELNEITHKIRYYDEVLTMSARMAAYTGDSHWEGRYNVFEKKLDTVIKQSLKYGDFGGEKTDNANQQLVEMERHAFALISAGRLADAQAILLSADYKKYKRDYMQGLQGFYTRADAQLHEMQHQHSLRSNFIHYVTVSGVLFIVVSAYVGFSLLNRSHRQQKLALEYRRMASLGRLSAGMAHEINNALQPILGLSDILRSRLDKIMQEGDTSEAARQNHDHAEMIYKNAMYAREIVENILGHSKGIQSQQEVYTASEALQTASEFASQSLASNISLKENVSFLDGGDQIRINLTDLKQIIKNIYINASHAMKDGGEILFFATIKNVSEHEAKIYDLTPGKFCVLSIRDTGSGMDKKTLSSIFEPFFTTKIEQGGTGLGLSVAYRMMKQMDGVITAESKKGHGSTFYLYFPLAS